MRRASLRAAFTGAATIVLALALAGTAHATTVTCSPTGVVTVNVTGSMLTSIETMAGDTDSVYVNAVDFPCAPTVNVTSLIINGDAGPNTITYTAGLPVPVTGDLGTGVDTLTVIGSLPVGPISGGGDNDVMNGGMGADTFNGGAGNDTLNGGVGADVLDGGTEDDLLRPGIGGGSNVGGAGVDTVTYDDIAGGVVATIGGAGPDGRRSTATSRTSSAAPAATR